MSSPTAVQSLRQRLFANGFHFVPIPTGKKEPPRSGWQATARTLTPATAAHWPEGEYLNTAILCDSLAVIDCDCDEPAMAEWIVSLAQQKLGASPVRYRTNSPRKLLLYNYASEQSSSVNARDADGKTTFQVLGQGKYFVADGVHPSGAPYLWSGPLAEVKRESLTTVTPPQLQGFLSDMQARTGWSITRKQDRGLLPSSQRGDMPVPSRREQLTFDGVLKEKYEALCNLQDGQGRNQFFNDAALQLSEMCSGWGCDAPLMERTLMDAMSKNGSFRDHGAQEIQATFKSAYTRGKSQPRARYIELPDIIFTVPDPRVPLITEAPRPLRRTIAQPNSFPIDSLGPFAWPAYAIADKIQCPQAIAALSVLGAASLAVQAHADVVLPRTQHVKPLSLFLVSIGESGERKSAADSEATRAISEYERDLATAYELECQPYRNARDAWESERQHILKNKAMSPQLKKNALDALIEPQVPLTPMLTCPEPTFEGLCQLYVTGHGALGLFSDEGGHFVGGHALSEDTRLRTAAGLSSLWDGKDIKRVRAAKDGSYVLPGRRLAMHLMLQPNVAAGLLSDPVLKDQGLLSRVLVSYPQSTAGTRFGKEPNAHSQAALDGFAKQLSSILRFKPMTAPGKRNQLTPRQLQFDTASHNLWCEFADKVEAELGPFGKYESIKGLANKLPEHAARIAGVMTLFENFYATHITTETLQRGITLAEHFASEALRLFDAGLVRPEIAIADSLLGWLTSKWAEPNVSVRAIQQFGPNAIRDAKTAKAAIATLEEHGWLAKAQPGTMVQGTVVRESWKIIRG